MKRDRREFLKTVTSGVLTASLVPLCAAAEEMKANPPTDAAPPENRADEALALMQEYGSCCTGVLAAFSPELGLNRELAAGVGRGMAGGMGGMGHVCGAVTGAIMAIGLKTTTPDNIHDMEAGLQTMDVVKEFIARFEEKHASIQCRELLGLDISTREKSMAAMEEGNYANCPGYVQSAATILEDLFRG